MRVRPAGAAGSDSRRLSRPGESARAAGADVVYSQADGRDASSIAKAFSGERCDLIVTVGGTGVGRADATVEALTTSGRLIAHGIALQPGRTTALGKVDNTPVVALAGAPDQALAAWWTLVLPALDRLVEHGYLFPLAAAEPTGGRPASPRYRVHPVCTKGTEGTKA